MASTKRNG